MAKVFKNGNSLAVVVPKVYAHQLNITHGSEVNWKNTSDGLTISKKNIKSPTEIDPEVAKLIKKLSKKYAGVWQDLAKV